MPVMELGPLEPVVIQLRRLSTGKPLRARDKFSIGSFNIQRSQSLLYVTQLAADYDIFFIQEFKATKKNKEAMMDYALQAGLEFHTGEGDDKTPNLTGIFVNKRAAKVITRQELVLASEYQRYSTNVRVTTRNGENVLFHNFYLPSGNKSLQAEILGDIVFCWDIFRETHWKTKYFYGGDLNHSVENTPDKERSSVRAIEDINRNTGTQDVASYNSTISLSPTNRSHSCRRIDRFYAPTSWRKRALKYEIIKPEMISSTHHMIKIEYEMVRDESVQIGKPRFQYPLHRLLPPFNRVPTRHIDQGLSIEEAFESIEQDGKEYILLMGRIRKHDPEFAEALLRDETTSSKLEKAKKATKMFFQTKKPEPVVFTMLTNEVTGECARNTPEILSVARKYYEELFARPEDVDAKELTEFLKPLTGCLSVAQSTELDEPFTKEELYRALKSSNRSTAPGPDGLQYSVLLEYWKEIGPILTRSANACMRTGKLPSCFRRVLITLIPKSGHQHSTDIKDQRPILLTNTSLKVVSKAVCSRLQRLMNTLIGPFQRGFMKGRRINQNTMEFFTMVDLIKKVRSQQNFSDYQAILMADFTKAFDRVSHQYMLAVLQKMGLGPSMQRLVMLIMQDQEAQLVMNNCPGIPFPINCGTRQGNPLSPLLFNLALEPFLCHLTALKGIPIMYENLQLEAMRYHAFADDVNIYLNDLTDYGKVHTALDQFQRVSNSRISHTKSKLLGMSAKFSDMEQGILPFPQTYIDNAEASYLGFSLQGVDWSKFIKELPFMTLSHGYSLLDLITRAIGTNVFVSSKTVYKDLVQCMNPANLRLFDQGISKVFKHISPDKMYARPRNGGYGVMEMKTQLQGHRAGVLLYTLTGETDWYTKYLRIKMLHHMIRIIKKDALATYSYIGGLCWTDFLLEKTGRFFRNLQWTFTENESYYFMAWKKVVKRSRGFRVGTLAHLTDSQILRYIATLPTALDVIQPFTFTLVELQDLQLTNFRSLSKQKQEALPPIMPGRLSALCPETNKRKRWKKFWNSLYTHEWLARVDFTAIHLFNHGSYVPHFDNQSMLLVQCYLCLSRISLSRIMTHLYNECDCSLFWWHKIGFLAPMHLREMLAPLNTSYENLRKLNWFVKLVYKVYSVRRREEENGHILAPLLDILLARALRRTDPLGR